ncbi:MAG: class III signal peptide-containing protein [Methanobacteriaceae archaeon]|nr:class III signal peptide-containing protein [Methanobacteriaceae archaeon]
MDKRGQVSVEYLLVILVLIVILSVVTIPLIGNSIDASNDVSDASDAKVATDTLANAADVVYANGPGAKRTVSFFVPQNGSLSFGNSTVALSLKYSNGTNDSINSSTQYNLGNNTTTINSSWHTATVFWIVGNSFISVTIT